MNQSKDVAENGTIIGSVLEKNEFGIEHREVFRRLCQKLEQ
jgi:hypothetical protein